MRIPACSPLLTSIADFPCCFSRLHPTISALRTSLDAAATFNVLLNYYRSVQRLKRSNPHIIYLIFTGAIAHLSGVRALRLSSSNNPNSPSGQSSSSPSSLGLQPGASSASASITAQYNLLSCVEALKDISSSWPLAERCHRIMTGLMDAEGLWSRSGLEEAASNGGGGDPYRGLTLASSPSPYNGGANTFQSQPQQPPYRRRSRHDSSR